MMVGTASTRVMTVRRRMVMFMLFEMMLENASIEPLRILVEMSHISTACRTSILTSWRYSSSSSLKRTKRPLASLASTISKDLRLVEKYTSDFSKPSILMSSSLRRSLRSTRSLALNWRSMSRRAVR